MSMMPVSVPLLVLPMLDELKKKKKTHAQENEITQDRRRSKPATRD
jgi:hypothetical protein